MKNFIHKSDSAFTLVETLMAIGAGSLMLAAILTCGVSLQRTFAAVENYSVSESDQLRVLDYIAMDCRRANSASVSGNTLTLTVPVYYNAGSSNQPYEVPTLTSGALSYGSGSVTIIYQKSGIYFNREVVIRNSGNTITSDTTKAIARNVSAFTVSSSDLTSSLSCSITFFPTFKYMTGSGTWSSGATVPANSVGNNGDYYVIDTTASDATTVGNVYFKSNGSYSLLQNIKATTVYSNTFLRNAVARM